MRKRPFLVKFFTYFDFDRYPIKRIEGAKVNLIESIKNKAKVQGGSVVLPEGDDPRMHHAAQIIVKQGLAQVYLLGNLDAMKALAEKEGADLTGVHLIDPENADNRAEFAAEYEELRKHKGMTREKAFEAMGDPLFYGAMMVRKGIVDCSVAGAMNTTGDVLRAALRVIGVKKGSKTVSSCFLMVVPEFQGERDKVFVFGDCAVLPQPTAEQLADIAIASAETGRKCAGIDPAVAMLSFSTMGSADHPDTEKVREAVAIAKEKAPNLALDGELQLDAAIIPKVGQKKAPSSPVAGRANVLIFPDLDAGNIGYKLVQRFTGAEAVGPIIQGLAKPANDLSRGCSIEDIVNVTAISIVNSAE